MTEMEQVIEQMRAMQEQSLQFAAQLQAVQAQNLEMAGRAVAREQEFAQYRATVQHGGGGASLAQKWAPLGFLRGARPVERLVHQVPVVHGRADAR